MVRKALITGLVFAGLLFFVLSRRCFADAAALFEQAKTYTSNGYRQEAEQIYRRIVEDYPGTDHVLRAQSELISLDIPEKQDSQIQAAIDSLIANYPNHPDLPGYLCDIAMDFGWAGKLGQAKNLYQQVIQGWSESSAVRKAQLGISRMDIVLLIKAGDYSSAETQTGQMLEDFSDLSSMRGALYHIARSYQWSRKYELAENIHQELILRYPNSDTADRARLDVARIDILVLIKTGDYNTAAVKIDKLLEDLSGHPGLPALLYAIAKEYEVQVKYEEASNIHQRIIQQWPDNSYSSQSRFNFPRTKILTLIESGNYAEGKAEFDKFAEQFSGHSKLPKAVYDIARKYEWLRQYEEARRLYRQVTERYSDSSAAGKADLGLSRINALLPIESGDYEAAGEEVEKLSEGFVEDPGMPEALYRIAKGYQERGEYERARSVLDQLIQQRPESSYAAKARIDVRVVNVLLLNKRGDHTAAEAAVDNLIADFNDQSALTGAIYQIEEG